MDVSADGDIEICKKDIMACLAIMIDDGKSNSASNVTFEHVDQCKSSMHTATCDLARCIREAFAAQGIAQHHCLSFDERMKKKKVAVSAASSPPPPPPLGPLSAQTLDYGRYKGVIVAPPLAANANAASLPLIILFSGWGGFLRQTKKIHGWQSAGEIWLPTCPKPCWYAYMDIDGDHRTSAPKELIRFIKDLYEMCSHNRNSIVGWGFSRGGKWLDVIVREHSIYIDAAIIIGGYPPSNEKLEQIKVARELIKVKSTIVCMVHFAADTSCNAEKSILVCAF